MNQQTPDADTASQWQPATTLEANTVNCKAVETFEGAYKNRVELLAVDYQGKPDPEKATFLFPTVLISLPLRTAYIRPNTIPPVIPSLNA